MNTKQAMQLSDAIAAGVATLAHNERPAGWRLADFGEVCAYVAPDAPAILGERYDEDDDGPYDPTRAGGLYEPLEA